MKPSRLYLAGSGGHGRELAWLARSVFPEAELIHVVNEDGFLTGPVNGIPVALVRTVDARPGDAFIAAVGDSRLRRSLVVELEGRGVSAASLAHPSVELVPSVRLGDGSVISNGCVLTENVEIGRHAHINVGCTLSHDVVIGEFATISPGVHIAGNVKVEADVFIGIGASVINGSASSPLVIGAGAIIAAGACVTKNVQAGERMAGVPARPLGGAN